MYEWSVRGGNSGLWENELFTLFLVVEELIVFGSYILSLLEWKYQNALKL